MFLTVIPFVGVVMEGFILTVNVGVGVAMLMGMGVYQIAMPVFVIVNVGMFMGILSVILGNFIYALTVNFPALQFLFYSRFSVLQNEKRVILSRKKQKDFRIIKAR